MTGEIVRESDLIFYKTAFPYWSQGEYVPYNIYIRNDPRKLDDIPFEGNLTFGKIFKDGSYRFILNSSEEFDCDGDDIIAIANLVNLKALNIKVAKDVNATCDSDGRYMFVNIQKGETSEIKQVGEACYELYVADCEILEVTERLMVEIFVRYYELIDVDSYI